MSAPAWPLFGHADAEAAFLAAFESDRLHHAWLITGPSGIGKARLAKRIAAYALGARGPSDAPMDASSEDPVASKLIADAHTDMRWLDRRPDDKGKLKQDIPVDGVRDLNAFFALRPAMGGWRVGVIDSLDELNQSGANAILKTLEEPPAKSLIILVSHGARALLPTIRSRCRVLHLRRLSEADTTAAITSTAVEDVDQGSAKSLAHGRPGHGLALASAAGVRAANAARSFFKGRGDASAADLIKHAGADETAFDAGVTELLANLRQAADDVPENAAAWLAVARFAAEARALNMDRSQAAAALVGRLQSTPSAR